MLQSRFISLLSLAALAPLFAAAPPSVGDKAPDFALSTVHGKTIRLSEVTSRSQVALAVLRGYPGYQCPFCNRQVQDFIQKAPAFAEVGVHVLFVYPGPPQDLGSRVGEFLADKKLPANTDPLLDPGYEFTNLYGLRWDAPHETAYPSTFLIDRNRVIFFSKVVKEHSGRTRATEILKALPKVRSHKEWGC